MRILVVEDDFGSRRMMQKLLEPYGDIDVVVDGEEAVQAFRIAWEEYKPYELLFMDIMMPKMDGHEALRRIREIEKELGVKPHDEAKIIMSRDNARTPMQWDSSAKAGFTEGEPWIGVNPASATVNVASAEADPDSVLQFLRRMIGFRKEHLALVYGSFELLAREDPRLLAFIREGEGERLLVEINMSGAEVKGVPDRPAAKAILSSRSRASAVATTALLAPWEARISTLR